MPPLTAIVSGFDCFVCGFRFWPILFAVLDEIFFGFAVSSIPQCPPREIKTHEQKLLHGNQVEKVHYQHG